MVRGIISPSPKVDVRRRRLLSEFFPQRNSKPAKKRVYISYSHKGDAGFKKFLETWHDGSDYIFIFSNYNSSVDITSREARNIKASITRKMRHAEYLLVLVGEHTHQDEWVAWEVERAQHHGVNLKIAGVKTNSATADLPNLPANGGTSWSAGFTKHSILAAIAGAGKVK